MLFLYAVEDRDGTVTLVAATSVREAAELQTWPARADQPARAPVAVWTFQGAVRRKVA